MKIKNKGVFAYSIALFILSASFVVFIFPRSEQFIYSYNIGNPWLYENLTADYDFPIYKTDEELTQEEDSLKKNFLPHYYLDTIIPQNFISKVFSEISNITELINNDKDNSLRLIKISKYIELSTKFYHEFFKICTKYYSKGVMQIPDSVQNSKNFMFYFDDNGISDLSYLNEFYNIKELAAELFEAYNDLEFSKVDSIGSNKIKFLISEASLPANLVFDNKLNKKLLEHEISKISPVSGKIQKGQVIIRKGSIVGNYEFKVLSSMQKHFAKTQKTDTWRVSIGISLVFLLLYLILFFYFLNFYREIINSFKMSTFFSILMFIVIFIVYIMFTYTDYSINNIPFVLFPLLMLTFYKFRVSFFIYLFSLFIVGFFVPSQFEFLIVQVLTGLAAMFSLKKRQKRQHIFITLGIILVSYFILNTGFSLMKGASFNLELLTSFKPFVVSSFLVLLYLPFIFVLEKTFGLLSDYTLMELSDSNNPALRLLAERAPGTFQHSVQVSNLVENIVSELGGNSLLARVGALYHDIGKTKNPEYFIENQSGANVHDNLDFEESAQRIISHVQEGMNLAKKYRLPSQVAEFITAHHGTSITRYFYNSWINANPDSMPIITNFQYPGPKPSNIETAVMMMADAVEAASRTLSDYTIINIENTVSKIIDSQLNDGQFDNVDITLKQIKKAKALFVERIKNIHHVRIVYPEINEKSN